MISHKKGVSDIINLIKRRIPSLSGKHLMAVLFMAVLQTGLALALWPTQTEAAFPDDIQKKNVIAEALDPADVLIFRDSGLEDYKESLPGEGFKIQIRKVEGDSLYGNYKCGDLRGQGWIPMETVVWDPDFEHVYATVRAKMNIYTDASCKQKKNTIRKYSGVILIGKEGNSRQVIYDKGDRYGIGWMKRKEYANNLKYDGRPKQILADGAYHFRCGYRDDAYGGKADQSGIKAYPDHIFYLKHLENDSYNIRDQKTGKYLLVKRSPGRNKWFLLWQDQADDYF